MEKGSHRFGSPPVRLRVLAGLRAARRAFAVAAVAAASSGAAIATADASGTSAAGPVGAATFSVFASGLPATGSLAPARPLAGAATTVLAYSGDGERVYAITTTDGEICVMDEAPSGGESVACDPRAQAHGGTVMTTFGGPHGPRMTAFVPDGVSTVIFALRDGTQTPVPVVNNVALFASPELASATYVGPDGAVVHAPVPGQAAGS